MTTPRQPSDVERIKASSRRLRGDLAAAMADPVTGGIPADQLQLVKFHGSYLQDDRDLREERRKQKLEPAYQFMLRTRLPGGVATPAQWLMLDELARTYGNGTLRLTTRQAFQLHGILKGDFGKTIRRMNEVMLDSIAACGDVNRNVMAISNPLQSALHARIYDWAARLSEFLRPKTRAYHELWLGEELVGGGEEEEPILGNNYLPRKFKIGLAVPPLNDVDVFANDLGFIAIVEGGEVAGFNVTVGGGMGAAHGDPATFPRVADVIGFIPPERLFEVAAGVVGVQRDYGDRSDRKHARLKYTIEDRGLAWFVAELEGRVGPLEPERPFRFEHNGDRPGWVEGEDGRWHLTLHIDSGRVEDTPERKLMTGLRAIAAAHEGQFRLTPNQNLIVAGVPAARRDAVDALAREHGLDDYRRASPLRLGALACVALPTCGLAMAEAERMLVPFVAKVDEVLARHGLEGEPLGLRITGCPNGCARPYLAEIALIGKAIGRYNLLLGGNSEGTRLNRLYRENIDEPEILRALDGAFQAWAAGRLPGERFGDFAMRSAMV